MFSSTHRIACKTKQEERRARIASLSPAYHSPLTSHDVELLDTPVAKAISNVQAGLWDPTDILHAYGKKAVRAHEVTNCLTEVMISDAERWAESCNTSGPLAGIPVSLKDTVGVKGWDSCIGYSAWTNKPLQKDSGLIRLLKDAGAVPFVKTGVPITLLSFESFSDVWGRVTNPHNADYSPGGSTGGEAALLAYGGSRIGIGTDVAGSVRVPAHYSGVFTIRASMHRFLKTGNPTSIPGQIGVPAVYSPMARTLEDLETFWKAVVGMKPWEYDHSCVPIPWREMDLSQKKLRWGVMMDDGVVSPSPACRRALNEVVKALEAQGHEVVDFNAPSPYEGLKIASQLVLADGCEICTSPIHASESNDPGVDYLLRILRLPSFLRSIYAFYLRRIKHDPIQADLLACTTRKSVVEYYNLIAQREGYRAKWFDAWQDEELDFLLTVPNALPAVPHGGMWDTVAACGYTFLFNLLDYSCGVLPILKVSPTLDALPANHTHSTESVLYTPTNGIARRAYKLYDATAMAGLPVGVQVVGRRLEEEKVLEGMKIVQEAMRTRGMGYELLVTH